MRVLIVRPEADARRSAERLASLGHEALVAPVLRIEPTGEPAPQGRFDAVAATSANAAPALASIRERIAGAPLFAVGTRTAEALSEAGLRPTAVGEGDAASLADVIAAALPPGANVVHVAGRDRKDEPAATLRRRGFRVAVWPAYAAVAADELPRETREAFEVGTLDAALHYSRRSVELLMALAGDVGCLVPLLMLRHACISDEAAGPLRSAGSRRLIVAARPDEDGLLESLPTLAS